jgi:uncharacterized protein (TIGR02246 family)
MKNRNLAFACCALMLLMGSVSARSSQSTEKPKTPEAEIRATLESTAAGWNSGDLAQYLAAYTDSATEMLSTGPAGGKSAIEKTMREGFWKTGRPVQKLRYENLEVRMLGRDHALVTGRFILSGADKPDRTGWFTTVWQRTKDGWKMIHDHS